MRSVPGFVNSHSYHILWPLFRANAICGRLAAAELGSQNDGLVGEILRENEVLGLQRILGLADEPFGRVVLGTGVRVERAVVDTVEIGRRLRQPGEDLA